MDSGTALPSDELSLAADGAITAGSVHTNRNDREFSRGDHDYLDGMLIRSTPRTESFRPEPMEPSMNGQVKMIGAQPPSWFP